MTDNNNVSINGRLVREATMAGVNSRKWDEIIGGLENGCY